MIPPSKLLLVFLAGCLTKPELVLPDPGDPCDAWGPFDEPLNISAVNTSLDDYGPWISDDATELYFGSLFGPAGPVIEVRRAKRASSADAFPMSEDLAFNSAQNNNDPFVSPDGLHMWFSSDRNGFYEVWTITRSAVDQPWDAATARALFRGRAPTLSHDLLTIYFSAHPNGGLWMATRTDTTKEFGIPVELTALNQGGETDPGLGDFDRTLMFHRGGRIVIATRASASDAFDTAVLLDGFDPTLVEVSDPQLTYTGALLAFTGRRQASFDIEIVRRTCLQQ